MGKAVLIVDDDPDIILYVSTILEKIGCHISGAKNGEEAMNKIKQNRPDLIILDVVMPLQSGVKLYRYLKTNENYKNIPICMLTGISKQTFLDSQEALSEFSDQSVPEPNAYVEKPLDPEQFTKIVQKFIQ
jgi:twitching motility two-component system response regulator PilH